MFFHIIFILLCLCSSMIQRSNAYDVQVDLKNLENLKGIGNHDKINQATSLSSLNSLLAKENVKEVVREKFRPVTITSNFKEELSILLSDIQLLYTKFGSNLTNIKPYGVQETVFLNTAVFDKNNKNTGEVDLYSDCQVRNVLVDSHAFCPVTLTYTANDSLKSSITFKYVGKATTSPGSEFPDVSSLIFAGVVNKDLRSVSADGVYFGKTFNFFKVKIIGQKITFYVNEVVSATLSLKKNPPAYFVLDARNNAVAQGEAYLVAIGNQVPPVTVGLLYHFSYNFPFYDGNGNFASILATTNYLLDDFSNGAISSIIQKASIKHTYILNDEQASSITFFIGAAVKSVHSQTFLSATTDGVFSGKIYKILWQDINVFTFTEVKSSYSGVDVVTNPFSVTWNKPPHTFGMYSFSGWDASTNPPDGSFPNFVYPANNNARQFTFFTTMEGLGTNGVLIGVHVCQPTFQGNGTDYTCQSTITYCTKDVLDSSITLVTSLQVQIIGGVMYPKNTNKLVQSITASGNFFGKTFNIQFVIFEQSSVTLAFTEVRNGKVVTNKPTKKPVFKPTNKPYSKKSNEKKNSNDKQGSATLGSSLTDNEPYVGAIVGITVGAVLLIGLLIGAYWYMKKLQLKNTPVTLEENM